MPSKSSVRICDRELPYRANGVRTPPSTKASVIVDLPEMLRTLVTRGFIENR
jgi:hypothetical protein